MMALKLKLIERQKEFLKNQLEKQVTGDTEKQTTLEQPTSAEVVQLPNVVPVENERVAEVSREVS